MAREVTLLRYAASMLVELSKSRKKSEEWLKKWGEAVSAFEEALGPVKRIVNGNVYIIEPYGHRTINFANGNFALKMGEKWLFINPRLNGHQWVYRSLEDMLNGIYIYSNAYVFSNDIFILDKYGRAKWLKPLPNEPIPVRPVTVPDGGDRDLANSVNRLIELYNNYGCIHPFTVISGCYELARGIIEKANGMAIIRPPFAGTKMAISDAREVRRLIESSYGRECGECSRAFIVDDIHVIVIEAYEYYEGHRSSRLGVRLDEFEIRGA